MNNGFTMRRAAFVIGILGLGGGLCPAAFAAPPQSEWDKNAKRCTEIFKKYDASGLRELYECVTLWESYRSPKSVKEGERIVALQAFNYLCAQGDEEMSFLAEQAVYRLGSTPNSDCQNRGKPKAQAAGASGGDRGRTPPTDDPGEDGEGSVEEEGEERPSQGKKRRGSRTVYNPEPVSKGAHERARALNKKAFAEDKRGNSGKALELYEAALDADPRYEMAIFNAACVYARTDQTSTALEYLRRLTDLGTDDSIDRLRKARAEDDFERLHDDDEFKLLTGFARIRVFNSKGEYGEDEVERIEEYFAKADYPVESTADYPDDLPFPVIFHKEGAPRVTALRLAKLVNHPKTEFDILPDDRPYDIGVVWGDTYSINPRTNEPNVKSHELKDPEKELDNVRREEDKALREPEKMAREAEFRARTGERVKSRVDSNIQRVEGTVDTMERTGKTIEKAGGLLK
jgi:tetratricopeptide (TPR) repeat protein